MAVVEVRSGSAGKASFYETEPVAAEHRGWVLGHFVTGEDEVPLTEDFEVKWSSHKVGESRDEWSKGPSGSAITLVIEGVHEFTVAPDGESGEVVSQRLTAGMAVFWENSVPHKWRTIEDSVLVTIRRL